MLTLEPRGRPQASANLVFPSTDPDADAGFIVLQADRAHAMSGSNTICVVTALLETGTIPMTEPVTVVTLETAAGLVRTEAQCRDGRCERVTFAGVPSFVEALDVSLDVPGLGRIAVDVAYGGLLLRTRRRRRARRAAHPGPRPQVTWWNEPSW